MRKRTSCRPESGGRLPALDPYALEVSEDSIPAFSADVLEGIADVLGATEGGLTGSEIATHLSRANVPDVTPDMTKRKRLFNALAARQNRDKVGNCVVAFIKSAMAPVRFRNNPAEFARLQGELDEVLIHAGLRITDEGKVGRAKAGKATTLDQAAEHAGTILTELRRRNTHPDLMRYCTLELLQKNNFHALLEAAKSIPDRIRALTGLTKDGAGLVDDTLSIASGPVVDINDGRTATDRSEQSGFANLTKGLLGLYRNPTAHDPKLLREVTDTELVDALTAMSMVHRRLDDAGGQAVAVIDSVGIAKAVALRHRELAGGLRQFSPTSFRLTPSCRDGAGSTRLSSPVWGSGQPSDDQRRTGWTTDRLLSGREIGAEAVHASSWPSREPSRCGAVAYRGQRGSRRFVGPDPP